ncbi:MAG: glycosyltransferase, partial [Calditrichaeota bacterium]
ARGFLQKEGLAEDLPENVIFLDQHFTPQQLPGLYRTMDAFVLPSHGEGWGRPLMEAMLMGLPTIATRWSGQLEFMNDENSLLVDCDLVPVSPDAVAEVPSFAGQKWAQPSLEHLGERMRYALEHRDAARELGARGREFVAQNFSRERIAKRVQRRIESIGKRMKSARSSILTVQTSPKQAEDRRRFAVVWEGSQFVYHSLALVNRELCSRLLEKGHEVSIVPYEPDQFSPGTDQRLQQLASRIGARLSRPADVHVRHQWPPKLTPPEQGHWVVMQPWEFGSLPEEWVPVFSGQVDECWVPSTYVKEVYVASGVPAARVHVIPNGVDPARFHPDVKPFSLRTKKRFKFLYVGGTIHRKGIDLLLRAFTEVFSASDEVCLVIKDLGGDSFYQGQTFRAKIQEQVKKKDAPEIEYIDAVLAEEEMAGLYTACDVLVHPYRGEGFGLPILEAMACGRAVIVTHGGAALDF